MFTLRSSVSSGITFWISENRTPSYLVDNTYTYTHRMHKHTHTHTHTHGDNYPSSCYVEIQIFEYAACFECVTLHRQSCPLWIQVTPDCVSVWNRADPVSRSILYRACYLSSYTQYACLVSFIHIHSFFHFFLHSLIHARPPIQEEEETTTTTTTTFIIVIYKIFK